MCLFSFNFETSYTWLLSNPAPSVFFEGCDLLICRASQEKSVQPSVITYNGERQPLKTEKALKRSCLIITTVGLLSRSYDSRQLTHKELNILGKMKANGSGHKCLVQRYLLKSSCSSIFREFQWTQY